MPDTAALREAVEDLRRDREKRADAARAAGLVSGRIVVPGSGRDGVVPLARMLYAERKDGRVHVHLEGGDVVTSNTTYTLDRLAAEPAAAPGVWRVHDRYVANLTKLAAIGPPLPGHKSRRLYLGSERAFIPLANAYATKLQRALGLPNLDHVVPWNDRYQAILDENLRDFEQPIQSFSVERLREEFRYSTVDKLQVRQLMSNMAWQYYGWLALPDGDPRKTWPIDGNIRSFWYHIKPVLSRLGVLEPEPQYQQLLDVFNALVRKGIFRYRDFGFMDEGEERRSLGPKEGLPHVLLIAEKAGHQPKLERLQAEFGFTVVALRGAPSLLSAEYLIDELAKVIDLAKTPLRLISMVDYDPAGAIIITAFRDHLADFGVESHGVGRVIGPERFSPEELPNVVFSVPMVGKSQRQKVATWMAAGGGVDGKPLGIECEALVFDYGRLRNIVAELVEQAKRPPVRVLGPESMTLAEWGLPSYFSAELLEEDEVDFWRRWAASSSARRR